MTNSFPNFGEIPLTGRLKMCLSLVKRQKLESKIIVDIGCSYGWLEWYLRELNLKEIIGIDPSKKAIDYAKKHVKGVKFFVSSVFNIPLGDNCADIVTMFDVIEHIPRGTEIDALKEINRILKRGGKFILTTPNSHPLFNIFDPAWYFGHRHYRKARIMKFLEESGFKILNLDIKGSYWSIIYLVWFYFMKKILKISMPRNKWLEKMEDKGYAKKKLYTIYAIAQKKDNF